jgi:hydroxypyruvate reductase
LKRIRLIECGHPVPDEAGVEGARTIAGIVASATEDDLIICVISGGASALLPFPAQPLTLEMKQETTRLLLNSGANINEINTVRKHLSSIKGGWLAALAYPAAVLSLILSDVIGNNLDVIGSGITAPDSSTYADAREILDRFQLLSRVPFQVRERIEEGMRGENPETPKAGHPAFQKTQNLIVGSNDLALNAARARAKALGYKTLVLSSFIEGETRDVARVHAAIAKEIRANGQPLRTPGCVISGGETTVTIHGSGKGGRNQEFALAGAMDIDGLADVVMLSGGTDGTDGPTDAAGAVCDGTTLSHARARNLNAREYLMDNNSYEFFNTLGDLIKTGPTNTNVMDVRLVLVA